MTKFVPFHWFLHPENDILIEGTGLDVLVMINSKVASLAKNMSIFANEKEVSRLLMNIVESIIGDFAIFACGRLAIHFY